MGIALIAAGFVVPPGTAAVYTNWAVGLVAANVAIALAGNRKWERPIAGAAAIWLFISGFVPSLLNGSWLRIHELSIGLVLVAAALSAAIHLRDDVRHARPLTM